MPTHRRYRVKNNAENHGLVENFEKGIHGLEHRKDRQDIPEGIQIFP